MYIALYFFDLASPEELFGLNIEQISAGVNITWNDVSSDVVTYMVEITQGICISLAKQRCQLKLDKTLTVYLVLYPILSPPF